MNELLKILTSDKGRDGNRAAILIVVVLLWFKLDRVDEKLNTHLTGHAKTVAALQTTTNELAAVTSGR